MEDLQKQQGTSLLCQAVCIISKPWANSHWSYSQFGKTLWFLSPGTTKIWRITLKNNREHPLCNFKLFASFHTHLSIQNGTVRNRQIWVKICNHCPVLLWNLTDGLEKIWHLFSAISSFVHHFIAVCEFTMELQSGNAKFGSKSANFVPCDLEIWQMTLKSNTAPLLCYLKFCASFHSHPWIQTGVTVR